MSQLLPSTNDTHNQGTPKVHPQKLGLMFDAPLWHQDAWPSALVLVEAVAVNTLADYQSCCHLQTRQLRLSSGVMATPPMNSCERSPAPPLQIYAVSHEPLASSMFPEPQGRNNHFATSKLEISASVSAAQCVGPVRW